MISSLKKNPYRLIFDIAQEGIWLLDAGGRVQLANPRISELLGDSLEELIERSVFDFVDERDLGFSRATFDRRRQGVSETYELRFRRKDRSVLWGRVSACPIMKDGHHDGALALIADITTQKLMEERLLFSEQRNALVAKARRDVVYETDLHSQRLAFSEGMLDIFGYPTRETNLQWWLDRVHPDDLSRITALRSVLLGGGADTGPLQYRFRRADNSWAEVVAHGYVMRNAQGEAVRTVGTMTDITEQKAANASAAQSAQTLQALFENTLDAILLIDDRGSLLAGNPSAAILLGYPHGEIASGHVSALTTPSGDSVARQLWNKVQQSGSRIGELTVHRNDGRMIDIEYHAIGDIRPGAHLVIARDVSERNRAAASLEVLTPRQREVLRLIAEGNSNRNISETLGISIKTVESHRSNLMNILDIHEVAGLVRFAIRAGLIRPF